MIYKTLKIKWPNKKPIVSKKDRQLKTFIEFKKNQQVFKIIIYSLS